MVVRISKQGLGRYLVRNGEPTVGVVQQACLDESLGDGRRRKLDGWFALPGDHLVLPTGTEPVYKNRAEAVRALIEGDGQLAKWKVYG